MRISVVRAFVVLAAACGVARGQIAFDWEADDEGFAAFQLQWERQNGEWGGGLTGSHSARMVETTGLADADEIADFETFLTEQSGALSDLEITIDVYKESSSGWKTPTGQAIPAFNDALDNSYSSLILVWLAHDGMQYSFGAELSGIDGYQRGLELSFLGVRTQQPMHSSLEVWLQTYQAAADVDAVYAIDNLIIRGQLARIPATSSWGILVLALALLTIATLLVGRRAERAAGVISGRRDSQACCVASIAPVRVQAGTALCRRNAPDAP